MNSQHMLCQHLLQLPPSSQQVFGRGASCGYMKMFVNSARSSSLSKSLLFLAGSNKRGRIQKGRVSHRLHTADRRQEKDQPMRSCTCDMVLMPEVSNFSRRAMISFALTFFMPSGGVSTSILLKRSTLSQSSSLCCCHGRIWNRGRF